MFASVGHALASPWGQPFMQRALVEVVLMGVCGGTLGCWVLFYELAYSAEALPHAMLPGLVGAALLGVPLIVGGAAGLLLAGVAVALAARTPLIGRDTSVAVVFTSFFGVGVLMALSPRSPAGISGLLFGDILGLAPSDLLLATGLAGVVLISLRVAHSRLLAVALDRSSARAVGASPSRVDLLLVVLIAMATLVAVQAMGNVLVAATLIAPAVAARPLARRLPATMAVAVAIAVAAGIAGLYLSYYADVAAGAAIAGLDVAACAVTTSLSALARVRVRRARAQLA
jgi:ABC-type Mn2+/Zn2+ transport system permease subunit